jgi:radical SAM superfamily enzyme YgiQ (UPF0313 family)
VRDPGQILLVACYELGHQPLAVAWPAAALERAGYAPAVMDISVEPFDVERARRARLVAISVPMHTALRLGTTVAARMREANPAAHVCLYGLYAGLNADHLLAHGAHSVIAGEFEESLVALARSLEAGGDARVSGVGRRGAPAPPVLERLPLPVPVRTMLPPLRKYARLERDGRLELAGYVEASRGCLHHCRHCPIPPVYGGRFFAVSRDVVLGDVDQLVAAGARHVTFGDPDFLNGPTHALRVAREVHAAFPGLTFDFTAKVEHLVRHERHLAEFASLGCVFIVTAVESLSDRVLSILDKGHTRADVERALGTTRAAGIALRPTWVPFTPWTTLDDYREMLDFIATQGLVDHVDPVQYGIRLLVPPGSLLLEHPDMRPHLGELVADAFHWRWTHPDRRMDALSDHVSRLVAGAAERREDSALTFGRVRAAADEVAGVPAAETAVAAAARDRARPPRLTEPWFC